METAVLLLTDVVGSTRLWQDEPGPMDAAMTRHHALVHDAVERHGGWRPVDQGEGDAVFAAFRTATAAVACAADVQRRLAAEPWPTSRPLAVRVGLHLGEVVSRDGNLYGDPVNRCARLRGLGHGGQVLLSSAVYEVVRDALPEGTSLRDLGEHRMKDLVRPEHVWQLDVAGLPQDFPALVSLDVARHNLPVQTSPLIGRTDEVQRVLGLLRSERLVTVVGFGGMGKTRLALQVAAEAADGDGDGVWFVDLSAVDDAADVPNEVARVLGARESGAGPAAAVVDAVRDKRMLLVLDNLEQVLDCAPFVADLLASAPGLAVLGTSREPLRLRAEQVVHLAPLELPPVTVTAGEELSTYAAVQLFLARAVAVNGDFVVHADNAPAIAEICTRLDGHPLAIELAAARTRVLTPDQILERLGESLSLLSSRSRDVPSRHQTLRATIAWSYDALAEEDQLLLQRLSVFAGSFDLAAAEAVCGPDLDVLEGLTTLVEKSLVKRVDERFVLLVSIRAFAADLLSAEQAAQLRARHADHYLDLLRQLPDEGPVAAPLHVLGSAEEHQLRHAVAHLEQIGTQPTPLLWFSYLTETGAVQEAEAGLRRGMHRQGVTDLEQARLWLLLCRVCDITGDFDAYWRHADRAVALCRRSGTDDPEDLLLLVDALSCRFIVELDPVPMLADVEEVEMLLEQVTGRVSPMRLMAARNEVASCVASSFRWIDPDRALAAAQSLDPEWEAAGIVPARIARIAVDTGRLDVAAPLVGSVTGPDDVEGSQFAKQWTVDSAARLALLEGDLDRAREIGKRAVAYAAETGAWGRRFYPMFTLADVELAAGDLDAAARWLAEAAVLAAEHGAEEMTRAVGWRQSRLHRLTTTTPDPAYDPRPLVDERHSGTRELAGCLIEAAMWEPDADARKALLARLPAPVRWPLPFGTDEDWARLS